MRKYQCMNKGDMRTQTQSIINERSCGPAPPRTRSKAKEFHLRRLACYTGFHDTVILCSPTPGTSIKYASSKHGVAHLAKISSCNQNGRIRWDGSESFLDEAATVEPCLRARWRLRHHFQHRHRLRYHQSKDVGKLRIGCEEIWGWQWGGTPEAFMSLTRTF